ncbi:hypothetical protein ACHAWF_015215 [Thalassiosira exigua]
MTRDGFDFLPPRSTTSTTSIELHSTAGGARPTARRMRRRRRTTTRGTVLPPPTELLRAATAATCACLALSAAAADGRSACSASASASSPRPPRKTLGRRDYGVGGRVRSAAAATRRASPSPREGTRRSPCAIDGAFVFALLKGRRRGDVASEEGGELGPEEGPTKPRSLFPEPAAEPVDGDREGGTYAHGPEFRKGRGRPLLDLDLVEDEPYANGDHTGGLETNHRRGPMDLDVVEDEPHADALHPVRSAYDRLTAAFSSSLSSSSSSSDPDGLAWNLAEGGPLEIDASNIDPSKASSSSSSSVIDRDTLAPGSAEKGPSQNAGPNGGDATATSANNDSLDSMEGSDDGVRYRATSEDGSLASLEGRDDEVTYVRTAAKEAEGGVGGAADGDGGGGGGDRDVNVAAAADADAAAADDDAAAATDPSPDSHGTWARWNARSIDEGIRFKSSLLDGLEEKSERHRERMLGDLLEGVLGRSSSSSSVAAAALEETGEPATAKVHNGTNPFRWLGFGRGGGDRDAEKKRRKQEEKESRAKRRDDAYAEIDFDANSRHNLAKKPGNRNFGARTIAGLIVALAEEVEGLEVEVDADPATPLRNKAVNSVRVYFSRLGFRQLRMGGGLDEALSESEATASAPAEKFALASQFFDFARGGGSATADEAFDRIDVDGSGALDEEELARALGMAAVLGGRGDGHGHGGGTGTGGQGRFGKRLRESLAELAGRLVRLYDANGDGVVDREEYGMLVRDMAALRDARRREEEGEDAGKGDEGGGRGGGGRPSSTFGGGGEGEESPASDAPSTGGSGDGSVVVDVTESEEFWGSMDQGEGSIVLEDLKLDLRRLVFGAIPGVKRSVEQPVKQLMHQPVHQPAEHQPAHKPMHQANARVHDSADSAVASLSGPEHATACGSVEVEAPADSVLPSSIATVSADAVLPDPALIYFSSSGCAVLVHSVSIQALPGGPLILKPFTATITASFNADDIMDSVLLDAGLRRLVARALSRRVMGIRDLLDGAVFYGRTWKLFERNSPQVEVAKLEDVRFDERDRLIITGRAKIRQALGYRHEPIEQGFKLRTKIGTRANGRIIGLLQPEIAIFAECPKDLEKATKCKQWFDYTIPKFEPLYTYIPLGRRRPGDKMDGFNMGEDNQIKSIDIKNGKLRFEICAYLRPGRFLGNHYLAFTVPNRTLILTLDRVREGMRNARRNKKLAELAAREVQQLATARGAGGDGEDEGEDDSSGRPSISPEGKVRIRRLEKELKATIQEDAIIREMEESSNKENGKSFFSRFVEGYSGAIREELDLEMNARLSSSISDFFGRQDREGDE